MFEFLLQVPLDNAVVAANHVIRAIEYRQNIQECVPEEGQVSNEAALREDQQFVALSIAREIRRRENLPISFLTDEAAADYTAELGKAVQRSVRHHLSNQEIKRGRKRLDQWEPKEARTSSGVPDLLSSPRFSLFLIGAGIGATLAVLFAPKSGQEFRDDIVEATRRGIDRSREAAQRLGEKGSKLYDGARETAGEYYEATRERAAELYDTATVIAEDGARDAISRLSGSLSAGKKAYVEEKRKAELSGRSETSSAYKPERAM